MVFSSDSRGKTFVKVSLIILAFYPSAVSEGFNGKADDESPLVSVAVPTHSRQLRPSRVLKRAKL
jgi:hypothetical protein